MTTLGLGPTPIPVELAHSLVALDKTDVEVVWMTSWHARADWLLEAVGIDDVLRSTDWESTSTVTDLKWMIVAAETSRDSVPFVWIDDAEINPQTWHWRASLDVPNLLVRPNG